MATSVLIKPLVTEKNTNLSSKLNKYVFMVNHEANKIEIKKAIENKDNYKDKINR